ncbi:unnamed protein product [Tilletia laevis]|uniref:HORMA domain-containing protein n=3 Tax=Tilletia TaxID=13289 RepID=A0A8X7T0U6_9BASI|nr:hypothetical protein CF336_g1000 [Tilletia laevis]KAE8205719.1 hypothetical protein CF328_g329 [Tilletia controversa]KAE8265759.1 hypothetical protein A4X03_0g49 [Tilletia caries]KAE8208220.1 hypothetical protein CF335_g583 [Tilletia laevis]KAE8255585.1 hypothetical protein A4X06_0g352 [Tilletia controversa]
MAAPSTSVVHSPLTYNELVQHTCAFFQVAIESLLCIRNVYPPEVFQRRKKYNTPVYQVRHPGLANYVGLIIKSIKSELYKASVERVVLVITESTDHTPLERFVFHLDYLIPVPPSRDRDLMIDSAPSLHELELYLRGFMLKLMLIEASLAPLPHPENTTFAVLLEYKTGHGPNSDDRNEPEEGPWVPADGQRTAHDETTEDRSHKPTFVPIKTFDSGVINLMLHVEDDTHAKAAARATLTPSSSFAPSQQPQHREGEEGGAQSSPRSDDGGDGSMVGFGMSDEDDGGGDWR